jgi:hypothetical protein
MRFYFHLHNDIETQDEEGTELADEAAARDLAQDEARTMAAESVRRGRLDLSHSVQVTDSDGTSLFYVTFGEAVTIRT